MAIFKVSKLILIVFSTMKTPDKQHLENNIDLTLSSK